jgi:hypothetical protein
MFQQLFVEEQVPSYVDPLVVLEFLQEPQGHFQSLYQKLIDKESCLAFEIIISKRI